MFSNKCSILAITALMALSLCACGSSEEPAPASDPVPVSPAPAETEEQEQAAPSSTATVGDYTVEIGDAFMATDWEGNPALVVSFTWTNNSGSSTSALVALQDKAFQDSVQLEVAMMDVVDGYDGAAGMLEVQPGGTHTYQQAYVCTSETSPVQVTVEEFLGDGAKAEKTFDITALGG